MVTKEQINRINELYKKKTEIGLTEEEQKEQAELRKLYINSVKQNLRAQLENIEVVSPEEYEKRVGSEHQHSKDCGCGAHGHDHKPKLKH